MVGIRALFEHAKVGSKYWLSGSRFHNSSFWVQVHELGLKKLSRENAHIIGDQIGTFIQTDEEVECKQRTYIRMKVEVNIDQPLMVGF